MTSTEITMTLDEAVQEVLGMLTGLDLTYDPKLDRYRSVTRMLNRALRDNALEKEWSCYAAVESIGTAIAGAWAVSLDDERRPRVINDDAVRLVDDYGNPRVWAYFLPREALHKYRYRPGLWCSVTTGLVTFSRPFLRSENGLDIEMPVMREPAIFRLPDPPEDPDDPLPEVPAETRDQLVDFAYPNIIAARAAYYYAQTDPVMQPRVQTLEQQYKNLMYQAIERDDLHTDSPYENDFIVPVQNGVHADATWRPWPMADRRTF